MTRGRTVARVLGRKGAILAIWLAAFGLVAELGKATGLSRSDRPSSVRPDPSDSREVVRAGH